MKLLPRLICFGLMIASCFGEALWSGGEENGRLTLNTGDILGDGYQSKGNELSFALRLNGGSTFYYPGGGVGQITGLLREGLAADARGRVKKVTGCSVNFQRDGKIELGFVMEKREFKVQLTRREARELVRIAGAFFDERISKHAKAEKDADLD